MRNNGDDESFHSAPPWVNILIPVVLNYILILVLYYRVKFYLCPVNLDHEVMYRAYSKLREKTYFIKLTER